MLFIIFLIAVFDNESSLRGVYLTFFIEVLPKLFSASSSRRFSPLPHCVKSVFPFVISACFWHVKFHFSPSNEDDRASEETKSRMKRKKKEPPVATACHSFV